MSEFFQEDKEYKGVNFTETPLTKGAYENCTFKHCVFTSTNLSKFIFVECQFIECDISMAILFGATLQDISFTGCKLMGLHFEHCSDLMFSVSFNKCDLKLSSFYQCSLKGTSFLDCKLQETDFTESELKESILSGCDLSGAIFAQTNLEGVDFRSSLNYSIDPQLNRIKKARFSVDGVFGLLDKHDIIID